GESTVDCTVSYPTSETLPSWGTNSANCSRYRMRTVSSCSVDSNSPNCWVKSLSPTVVSSDGVSDSMEFMAPDTSAEPSGKRTDSTESSKTDRVMDASVSGSAWLAIKSS